MPPPTHATSAFVVHDFCMWEAGSGSRWMGGGGRGFPQLSLTIAGRAAEKCQRSPSSDTAVGPLMGGPQCRLSILRNGNVPCHYFRNFPVE